MTYQETCEYLFNAMPMFERQGASGYKEGLENSLALDEHFGHPHEKFLTIHVAGTNGKGSCSHTLSAILQMCGYRVGLYTSPHLVDFSERIRVNGQQIPEDYVVNFVEQEKSFIESLQPSFFEVTTAMAFKYFAEMDVDIAVIEVGLGGRLDCTNIITPILSVITNIGMDHMAYLGDTPAEIAAQKAGIFKEGVPALVGESAPETDPVFAETAWMKCPLTFADKVKPSLWGRSGEMLEKMDLRAVSQQKNLRTVLAALDILRDTAGLRIDEETLFQAIVHTAARTGFHGRWEKLSDVPYVLCDIGHNAHALRYNFAQLRREVSSGRFSSLIIVYGIMADKDLDPILPLMPEEATYIFCAPDTARALPAQQLLDRYKAWRSGQGLGSGNAFAAPSVREAVRMATARAQALTDSTPPLIYIGGSTFVVSEAINLFRK